MSFPVRIIAALLTARPAMRVRTTIALTTDVSRRTTIVMERTVIAGIGLLMPTLSLTTSWLAACPRL
jgi:hypothetical protein